MFDKDVDIVRGGFISWQTCRNVRTQSLKSNAIFYSYDSSTAMDFFCCSFFIAFLILTGNC